MKGKVKYFVGDHNHCYICGLKIPTEVVSPWHPLFGTIDHVRPRSKGGSNGASNKRAAHRICNARKKDLLEVTPQLIQHARASVALEFKRLGINIKPQQWRSADRFVGVPVSVRQKPAGLDPLARWEDDGGSYYAPPMERTAR